MVWRNALFLLVKTMGDVMDSTLTHINKEKAHGTQGNASKGPKNNILDYLLLTLHVPTPSSHPTDSVETVKAQFL